jgi:ADP-dependent phosphofructokinase/glucokinase
MKILNVLDEEDLANFLILLHKLKANAKNEDELMLIENLEKDLVSVHNSIDYVLAMKNRGV